MQRDLPIEIWAHVAEFALRASWDSPTNCLGALVLAVRGLHEYLSRYGIYEHIRKGATRRVRIMNADTFREQDEIPGRIRHGLCLHWAGGELRRICRFYLGKRHGARTWLLDGEIICSEEWEHGYLHGEVTQKNAVFRFERDRWVEAWTWDGESVRHWDSERVYDGFRATVVTDEGTSVCRIATYRSRVVCDGVYRLELRPEEPEEPADYEDPAGVYSVWMTNDTMVVRMPHSVIRTRIVSMAKRGEMITVRGEDGSAFSCRFDGTRSTVVIRDSLCVRLIIRRDTGEDSFEEIIYNREPYGFTQRIQRNGRTEFYSYDELTLLGRTWIHRSEYSGVTAFYKRPSIGRAVRSVALGDICVRMLRHGGRISAELVSIGGRVLGSAQSWGDHGIIGSYIYNNGYCLGGYRRIGSELYLERFHDNKLVSRTLAQRQ